MVWSGNGAGIDLAGDSVPIACDEPVAQISQWPWNDPEQASDTLPETTQHEQQPTDRGGSHRQSAFIKEIDRGERHLALLAVQGCPGFSIDGCEPQSGFSITGDRKAHDLLTHAAFAIVKQDWPLVPHTKSIGFGRRLSPSLPDQSCSQKAEECRGRRNRCIT